MKSPLLLLTIILTGFSLFHSPPEQVHTFHDSRDGNDYTYTQMNGLNWFGENLRFEMPESMCVSE